MKKYMNYEYDTHDPTVRQKLIQENVSKNKIRKRITVKRMGLFEDEEGGKANVNDSENSDPTFNTKKPSKAKQKSIIENKIKLLKHSIN